MKADLPISIPVRAQCWRTISRLGLLAIALGCVFALSGCSAGNQDYNQGKKAEAVEDWDTAVVHYQRALQADPTNTDFKLKLDRTRFEAAQHHVEQGEKIAKNGDLQMALAEYQKASMIDPSSPIAQQEIQTTLKALAEKNAANQPAANPDQGEPKLMTGPPELTPLSRAPINLQMTDDSKMVYAAVAKLAGLTVIFDPDYTTRRVSVALTNVTIEQALDFISLQAKAFWKPETNNVIFVTQDTQQKRRDYDEYVVQTFYLQNTILPQDITEIVNDLRQLLDITRIQQFNAQNAIVIRTTPARMALAAKIIDAFDKPKPEVLIQFEVLSAERDRMRDLGINPGSASATLSFNPPGATTTTSNSSSTSTSGQTNTTGGITLNQIRSLSTADYSLTLPSATATALLTDSTTHVIDDPQIRIVDGQDAKLDIGERVPIATGSFQAGVGVGAAGTGGSLVNPLVNTQFQYQQVGVLVDVTPRIHVEDREVSLKLSIEVSSVSGTSPIGGINQPIISSSKVEHNVRLRDGEINLIGGLTEITSSKTRSGFPGLSQIPLLRYFTSDNTVQTKDQEVVIVVIPHIIRTPNITADDLRSLLSGTETYVTSRSESSALSPTMPAGSANAPAAATPATPAPVAAAAPAGAAKLSFQPGQVTIKPGETSTISVTVQDAQDLYSVPLLLQYDPKIISVENVLQGTFLGAGAQQASLVQRVDKEQGQVIVSDTRMPGTPGVNGSGSVFQIVVRGVAAGTSNLSIVQVNGRDSQQRPLTLTTSGGSVKVQP